MAIFAPPVEFIDSPRRDITAILGHYQDNRAIAAGEKKGPPKDYNIWNMESWKMIPMAGPHLYWWLGGGEEKVTSRRISNPLKDSKKELFTEKENKAFLAEIEKQVKANRLTPKEAASKRGTFFRNQAQLRARKLNESRIASR
jgi:hypothetical protein